MLTFSIDLNAEEIAIIGDALADMVDDLEAMSGGDLLLQKTKAALAKIEAVEQTKVHPH